jgi:hypothetical protein
MRPPPRDRRRTVHTKRNHYGLNGFDISSEAGKERRTAYQFVRNVFDSFVPVHLQRIQSAIDQLPDLAIGSSQCIV